MYTKCTPYTYNFLNESVLLERSKILIQEDFGHVIWSVSAVQTQIYY